MVPLQLLLVMVPQSHPITLVVAATEAKEAARRAAATFLAISLAEERKVVVEAARVQAMVLHQLPRDMVLLLLATVLPVEATVAKEVARKEEETSLAISSEEERRVDEETKVHHPHLAMVHHPLATAPRNPHMDLLIVEIVAREAKRVVETSLEIYSVAVKRVEEETRVRLPQDMAPHQSPLMEVETAGAKARAEALTSVNSSEERSNLSGALLMPLLV